MSTQNQILACSYAALLLHDSNQPLTAEKIGSVTKASGIEVARPILDNFAKCLDKDSISKLITSLTTPGAGVGASASASANAHHEKKEDVKKEEKKKEEPKKEEKKKEEPKEEEDEGLAGGFDLFGGAE